MLTRSEAKSPTSGTCRNITIGEDLGMDDATSEHLEPSVTESDLHLEARLDEREIVGVEAIFLGWKEMACQPRQNPFKFGLNVDGRIVDQTDTFDLMENGEVSTVDLVFTIDITTDQELLLSRSEKGNLMSRSVGSQNGSVVEIVGVTLASSRVILSNPEEIEVLLRRNIRRERVILSIVRTEVVKDFLLDQLQRMIRTIVEVEPDFVTNTGRNVRHRDEMCVFLNIAFGISI